MVFVLITFRSTVFAEKTLETGYDLYYSIKLCDEVMDNRQSPEDFYAATYTSGYLAGYLEGIVLLQSVLFETMFPSNTLSEKQREKLSKEINFHRLNIPDTGLAGGQVMLIYKKWAEKNPEKLNESARVCLFGALVEAYGWK